MQPHYTSNNGTRSGRMAVFTVTLKVMITCQSEGDILYSDLYNRLTYPQRHTNRHKNTWFVHFACVHVRHAHLRLVFFKKKKTAPRRDSARTKEIWARS